MQEMPAGEAAKEAWIEERNRMDWVVAPGIAGSLGRNDGDVCATSCCEPASWDDCAYDPSCEG